MISKEECDILIHLKGVYYGMRGRCYSKKNKDYKYYGAKGVRFCNEWLEDFYNFYSWAINNGYKHGLTIDRIDNNGNYEPSNCRWVTMKVQSNNRGHRPSKYMVTFCGRTLSLSDWAKELNVPRVTLYSRFAKGFDVSEILSAKNLKTARAMARQDTDLT